MQMSFADVFRPLRVHSTSLHGILSSLRLEMSIFILFAQTKGFARSLCELRVTLYQLYAKLYRPRSPTTCAVGEACEDSMRSWRNLRSL